ncbi:putative Cyclic di-GMP binding protein [Hollandina sp. SP2]
MNALSRQQLITYYERYKTSEVIFNKEILEVTGLLTKQVCLKCMGKLWPCIIYAASLQMVKVLVNTKSGLMQSLQDANNGANVRFCFKGNEGGDPVIFFVAVRSIGYMPYRGSKDMAMVTLQFVQQAPDYLIGVLGRILDTTANSEGTSKRRGERVIITSETQRMLGIVSKETAISVQGVPRQCILRDISFYGAKIVIVGLANFLNDREAVLRIDFEEPRESYFLKGKFCHSETVEGRKDLVAMGMSFYDDLIPMKYKIRINTYITQVRAVNRTDTSTLMESSQEGSPSTSKISD